MPNESTGDDGGHSQAAAVSKLPAGDRPCTRCGGSKRMRGPLTGMFVDCGRCDGTGVEPDGCAASEHLRVVTARPPETKLEGAARLEPYFADLVAAADRYGAANWRFFNARTLQAQVTMGRATADLTEAALQLAHRLKERAEGGHNAGAEGRREPLPTKPGA